jgi:ketosteroid isomerase-like protein
VHESLNIELRTMVAAWDEAMIQNDPETIGRFMHEDWVLIGSDGGVSDKPTFLAQIREGRLSHDTMTSEDLRIRGYGEVAVAHRDRRVRWAVRGASVS